MSANNSTLPIFILVLIGVLTNAMLIYTYFAN